MFRDEIEELWEEYCALKAEHADLIEEYDSGSPLFSEDEMDIMNDYFALKEMLSPYLDYISEYIA